jgi:hypothetical protein
VAKTHTRASNADSMAHMWAGTAWQGPFVHPTGTHLKGSSGYPIPTKKWPTAKVAEILDFRLSKPFEIWSLPAEQRRADTPPAFGSCSCVLLDVFRASHRGHPWPDARSPRFG